jgi:hypothetical protein
VQTKTLSEYATDNITGEALAFFAAALDVPTISGSQAQGDVYVVPAAMAPEYRTPTGAVPPAGVPVVRGENGGNAHLLLAAGPVRVDVLTPSSAESLALAHLLVPAGAVAWLDHPQHGNSGIGPGEYVLRRKREQADEIRLVAD